MIHLNICNLFYEQVKLNPERIAVMQDGNSIAYLELNKRANSLAHFLVKNFYTSDQLKIGIALNRSIDLIVAILATLKANAVCVPLDLSYPEDRLNFMATDAEIDILLTSTESANFFPRSAFFCKNKLVDMTSLCLDELIHEERVDFNISNVENLIYILYTSGSTGNPKGVAMPHKVLLNLIDWHLKNIAAQDKQWQVLQYAPISFDVAFQEIFSTLCTGKTLILIQEHIRSDPYALSNFLKETCISQIFIPVVTLQQLASVVTNSNLPESLKIIITAGEQLRITPEIRLFLSKIPDVSLYNHYGPTETHVVTSYKLPENHQIWPDLPPIGFPITNVKTYILDEHLCPVVNKTIGELYIGGEYMAEGYCNNSNLTKERFVNNPFEAGRLYKTGDMVYAEEDGCIHFVERRDKQVKIRGFRVEINEIEMALLKHSKIKECAIVDTEIEKGYKSLVAYIILDQNAILGAHTSAHNQILSTELTIEFNRFLNDKLAPYMIPSLYIIIDKVPLTLTNKIDRNALSKLGFSDFAPLVNSLKLSNKTLEEKITLIWETLLQISPIDKDQNFFDLGGHSLLLLSMYKMLLEVVGHDFPMVLLLQNATIESLTYFLQHLKDPTIQNDVRSKAISKRSDLLSEKRKKIRAQMKQRVPVYD